MLGVDRRHSQWRSGVTRGIFACSLVGMMLVSGCSRMGEPGRLAREPTSTVRLRRATQPWVLIKNPRFGDVRGEPEYIWVEEDQIPTTPRTILFGKRSIIAPPKVVAKHGPPPNGGAISRLHSSLFTTAEPGTEAPGILPREIKPEARLGAPPPAARMSAYGYVVFVKRTRILVDLTDKDGLQPGSILSIRQPIPVVHPVTGQLLGTYEDEVATAKVVEVHGMFSVADIEEVSPGVEIKLKDRVIPR